METTEVIHPFDPIFNSDSRILILGSFPSVISRKQSFYYANPNNRFWNVMRTLFDDEIADPKQFCLDHGIALWDVIHSCTITGSSDTSIRNVVVNDLSRITDQADIRTIFTTGGKASKLFEKYMHTEIQHISLPSTSGANARMRLDDLVKQYQVIKEALNEQ